MSVGKDKQKYYRIRNKNDMNPINFIESFPDRLVQDRIFLVALYFNAAREIRL